MATPFALAKEATTGFSDGSHYDKYRPSYTSGAVHKLLTHLKVAGVKNAKIIDLACGTGKFTEVLAARPEDYEVIAVEPHMGMRGTLEEKNLGPRVRVLDGNAGHIPVDDGWADALIAAQAFHWFATEESLREIHRVLTPGSAFGMIWNIEDYNGAKEWVPTTSWEKKLKEIVASMEDGKPRFRHLQWKEIFDKQIVTTPLQTLKDTFTHNMPEFSLPLGEETLKWTVWLSDEAVWNRYSTLSQVANSGPKKEEIRKEVFEALKSEDTVRNENGEVAVHGITYLAWTSRL